MRVPVPTTDSIARIVAEAGRIPATAAATARSLPTLAKGAVDDTRRLGLRGTALAVTGAAVSGAASVATSLLARRHPLDASTADRDTHTAADGPEGHGLESDSAPLDELDRFATAEDWEAEVSASGSAGEGSAPAEDASDAASLADEVAEDHAEAVESGEQLPGRELPLPNFDSITIGSLRGHLRALHMDDLVTLRAYEQAHAGRAQVLTMLENRIAKLAKESS